MSWASAISAFFKAIGGIFGYFRDGRLKQAGKDAEARKVSEKVLKDVEKRADALRDSDKLKRVRSQFQRD